MPELSRFFGIIIRMFAEVGAQHHVPHFHAYYQDEVGIFGVDPVEIIGGSLPRRQKRLEAVAKPVLSCCQGTVLTVPKWCLQNSGFSR